MTQPLLFAVEDGEHSAVTEGGIIVPATNADQLCRNHNEERKRGNIAEHLCAIELIKRGYTCNVIGSNCMGYDIIADRADIRPQFVQVKHGFLRNENDRQQRYHVTNHSKSVAYGANAYDILAFYMWDREQWLVYGRAEFGDRALASYTPPDLRKQFGRPNPNMADRQPNNWELFDQLAMANSQESLGLPPPMSDPLCQNPPIP